MTLITRVSSDGRTTIPVEIRRRLGLTPGDVVVFTVDESGAVVVEPVVPAVDHVAARFRRVPAHEQRDDPPSGG
jgi:AbrB family looped-hinge helix DNA binding protein